ncbi:hypothetical protein KVR01_006199 [Diaporthe batatas]|uniref:uncharacterized protein n=1 Tax=Diaporthe batatas TaxID=748121 RepID=UPI001D047B19|nr:uncharacterized protein KVR01_006199 [Diaporthe batatas]KAG8164281.1 hypothetical protein KVR01_006199 [Diaporthe batatas]
MSTFWLLMGFYAALTHQSGFSSPNYVVSYGPGQYQSNVLWYVGETKEVVYDISDVVDGLETYTIALWQQSMAGGGANLGPVVNSEPSWSSWAVNLPPLIMLSHTGKAATDSDQHSFTWTVNLYEFDVTWSNVFFFWIFNGSASDQGNMDGPNVSSAYFNITADDPQTVSSTTSSATSTTSTSTPGTSTLTSATTSEFAGNIEPTQTTVDSATTAPTSKAADSGSSDTVNGGGISTGARIGIGVGVGLVGISAVVCAGIIVWYKRKKRGSSQENTHYGGLHELPTRVMGTGVAAAQIREVWLLRQSTMDTLLS